MSLIYGSTYSSSNSAGTNWSIAMSNMETAAALLLSGASLNDAEFLKAAAAAEVLGGAVGSAGTVTPTYGTTVTLNGLYRINQITATDTVAFTINPPTNITPYAGQRLLLRNLNSSGGTQGTITWGTGIKAPTYTKPANGTVRWSELIYNGTQWELAWETGADITP